MDYLNINNGVDIQLLTTDPGSLVNTLLIGDIVDGRTLVGQFNYFGKSRSNGNRIAGSVKVVATSDSGSILLLGYNGNYTELHPPVADVGMEEASFEIVRSGTELSIQVTGIAGQGDIDWYIYIKTKQY